LEITEKQNLFFSAQLAMAMGMTASALWAPPRPFPAVSIIGTTPTDTCSLPVDEKFINKSCL